MGRTVLPLLGAGFRELDRAVAAAFRSDEAVLVISVAPVFASKWLVPRLAGFSRLHPELKVRLDASIELVDPNTSDIDLAIRVGPGNWPGVEADYLLAQEVFPVCAPELASRLATPRDILSVPVVYDANSTIGWSTWLDQIAIDEAELKYGHSFTDASLCLDAAIAGQGIMLAWQTLAHDAIAAGRLIAPFRERAATGLGYWLVTSGNRRKPPKVRSFERWIPAMSDPKPLATAAYLVATHIDRVVERSEPGRLQCRSTDVHRLLLSARPFSKGDLVVPLNDLGEQALPRHIRVQPASDLHGTKLRRVTKQCEHPLLAGPPSRKPDRVSAAPLDMGQQFVIRSQGASSGRLVSETSMAHLIGACAWGVRRGTSAR
jgi:DNA-binding transcriptional LysR family regulator